MPLAEEQVQELQLQLTKYHVVVLRKGAAVRMKKKLHSWIRTGEQVVAWQSDDARLHPQVGYIKT